jgi:hypothetical protein
MGTPRIDLATVKDPSIRAQLASLYAENDALKEKADAKRNVPLSFKIGEKGGLSVYGLGRFPVTLYKSQWMKLLDRAPDIKSILDDPAHAGVLKEKE